MPVPEIVHRLVDRFEEDRKTYRSSTYKEEWIRQDFIDPLFEALGWDVTNKSGVPVGPQRGHPRGCHQGQGCNQSTGLRLLPGREQEVLRRSEEAFGQPGG